MNEKTYFERTNEKIDHVKSDEYISRTLSKREASVRANEKITIIILVSLITILPSDTLDNNLWKLK